VTDVLERLRGRLIVSVQAEDGSLLGAAETIALLARVAVRNGAGGVRIEGATRIAAVRAALPDVPIVGIVKRRHVGFAPYITSVPGEVAEVAAAGADLVAFDATARARAQDATVEGLIAAARGLGLTSLADCATRAEAEAAARAGADAVATTLAGYTDDTRGRSLPALDVVAALAVGGRFVVCEGGIATPEDARRAFAAGAAAIVVGTAITNVDALVRRFAEAAPARPGVGGQP
jgi:putative N-acetylmannosamine-6-phosphate epimerase